MSENDTGKKVDEEWKRQAEEEKKRLSEEMKSEPPPREGTLPKPTFVYLVSGLVSQVLIGLGHATNPITSKQEKNLDDAKFAIDTLQLLHDKTKGNLTEDEKKYLDSMLYDLRMRFLETSS